MKTKLRGHYADNKMLFHALDATANCATELFIHSPDTDNLVLSLRHYPELCVKTSFVTGTGDLHRVIELGPIASALGSAKLEDYPPHMHSAVLISLGVFLVKEILRTGKRLTIWRRRRRCHNCFGEPWNHAASSEGHSNTCGEVYLPA